MRELNQKTINAILNQAIKRQEFSGGLEKISDILKSTECESQEYWCEFADELHRREKFYDSLDCWREAEKYIKNWNIDDEEAWYLLKIRSLINAASQTSDSYFDEMALLDCEKLLAKNINEKLLNIKLQILIDLDTSIDILLPLIELILDEGFKPDFCFESSTSSKIISDIENYSELAECYLLLNQPSEAFRVWAKAIKNDKSKENICLTNAIFSLVSYADHNGFDDQSFLSSSFMRIEE
jgi:tetratricopeptide (TPR) repeat protein